MKNELDRQEAVNEQARRWVIQHKAELLDALRTVFVPWVERIRGNIFLLETHGMPPEDMHSGPWCNFVDLLKPDLLKGVQVIKGVAIQGQETYYPQAIDHKVLQHGQVIIDCTFGQFTDLDDAIERFPQLFEDRIFIGSVDEMEKLSGVTFLFAKE